MARSNDGATPMPRSLFRDGDDSDEYGVLFELQRRRNDPEKVVR